MANILASLNNFKLLHTIVNISAVYPYIFIGTALLATAPNCAILLCDNNGTVLENRKQEWGVHVETIVKCGPPASQWPFSNVTPKGGGWRALTSLAMSLEALALLMEIASALRS